MHLKHIKAENCPSCLAPTVSESCHNYHCNGQGFEERSFKCGCTIAWSPNFEQIVVKKQCSNSEESKRTLQLRNDLVKQLQNVINESKADDDFKRRILIPNV